MLHVVLNICLDNFSSSVSGKVKQRSQVGMGDMNFRVYHGMSGDNDVKGDVLKVLCSKPSSISLQRAVQT